LGTEVGGYMGLTIWAIFGWLKKLIANHETRITAIEQTLPTLGIKFESLPAVTSGTRMAGASSLTFRVNSGSMDLDAYPATDIRITLLTQA